MRVTTITVGRTIAEGDFEFTRIDLTADIKEGENEIDVADELFKRIKRIHRNQR